MKAETYTTQLKDIKRNWYLFDACEVVLGRLATQVAELLMGKNKPYFSRHLDCGDYVVIINAEKVRVTGKKEQDKKYYHHSGYPSGLKQKSLAEVRGEHPERLLEHAVSGMLPKNKLRAAMLKRLKVFAGENYPFKDKFRTEDKEQTTAE